MDPVQGDGKTRRIRKRDSKADCRPWYILLIKRFGFRITNIKMFLCNVVIDVLQPYPFRSIGTWRHILKRGAHLFLSLIVETKCRYLKLNGLFRQQTANWMKAAISMPSSDWILNASFRDTTNTPSIIPVPTLCQPPSHNIFTLVEFWLTFFGCSLSGYLHKLSSFFLSVYRCLIFLVFKKLSSCSSCTN